MNLMMRAHIFLTPGQIALQRKGKIVWVGALGSPIEDGDCDTLLVAESDYEDIKRQIPTR